MIRPFSAPSIVALVTHIGLRYLRPAGAVVSSIEIICLPSPILRRPSAAGSLRARFTKPNVRTSLRKIGARCFGSTARTVTSTKRLFCVISMNKKKRLQFLSSLWKLVKALSFHLMKIIMESVLMSPRAVMKLRCTSAVERCRYTGSSSAKEME